jgi:hypothetical protein
MTGTLARIVITSALALLAATCDTPPAAPTRPAIALHEPGVTGSYEAVGCGDGLWFHTHVPERLLIKNDCVTVTGVIMDATINQPIRQADGVRHEPDGDTHGWLRLDPEFSYLLSAGNLSDQGGNLVWEMVCHFPVTQADSIAPCSRYTDTQVIPPIGSHVAITGTLVQDVNHPAAWMEVHPVSRIVVR